MRAAWNWSLRLWPGLLVLVLGTASGAQNLNASGGWSLAVDATHLVAGAGTDLRPQIDSPVDAAAVTVNQAGGAAWRVDVRRTETTWPAGVSLSVRRSGDGGGGGTVTAGSGTAWQVVGPTNVLFFTGSGVRAGIPLQFRISGLSVAVSPASYSTTVTYTVVLQ